MEWRFLLLKDIMRKGLLGLVLVSSLVAAEEVTEVTVAEELKKFEGTWVIDQAFLRGKAIPRHKGSEFKFKNSICTSNQNDKVETFEIAIDPSKKLKEISTKENGKAILGVYELEGDNLKICFGEKRPDKMNKNDLLYVLKRAK